MAAVGFWGASQANDQQVNISIASLASVIVPVSIVTASSVSMAQVTAQGPRLISYQPPHPAQRQLLLASPPSLTSLTAQHVHVAAAGHSGSLQRRTLGALTSHHDDSELPRSPPTPLHQTLPPPPAKCGHAADILGHRDGPGQQSVDQLVGQHQVHDSIHIGGQTKVLQRGEGWRQCHVTSGQQVGRQKRGKRAGGGREAGPLQEGSEAGPPPTSL